MEPPAFMRGALQPLGGTVQVGTVQRDPSDPVPTRSPPQGGERRYVLSEILVQNTQAGAYSLNTGRWRATLPSTRLQLLLAWTFEPDGQEDTTFPAGGATAWLLSADAWIKPRGRRITRGNNLFSARPVPTSYETVSGVDEIRGTVVVPADSGLGTGTGIVPGTLWFTAMWEPAAGAQIGNEELAHLFQACNITTRAIATTDQGSGG